ncbi:MAG: cysteine hydrolase family protein [Dehalococcoidia bacterium]
MSPQATLASRPYPWPWHGRFDPRHMAFLVCTDDWCSPMDGPLVSLVSTVLARVKRIGATTVWLPGRTLAGAVAVPADLTVVRPHHGGFSGTDLDFLLRRRGLNDLVFAGAPFELGADCTMRQANDLGYECLALQDCSAGLSQQTFDGAFGSIQMSGGIFGAVAHSETLLELFEATPSIAT